LLGCSGGREGESETETVTGLGWGRRLWLNTEQGRKERRSLRR
jgi:hypothetical protein